MSDCETVMPREEYEVRPATPFVSIPATTLPNGTVVPAFRVGRYLCSRGPDGKPTITPDGKPWVEISYHAGRQACADAGYALLTESQALALALQIASVDANWSEGKVGAGDLKQGLRNWTVRAAQPGTFTPSDPIEDRWFALPNGERICDAAGNAYAWIFDDVQGDAAGLVAKKFTKKSPSISTAPFPSLERGMGWYPKAGSEWSGDALLRGGCWLSGSSAGVFRLGGGWPDSEFDYVGFRCTLPGL
jgi:hypothetical protein